MRWMAGVVKGVRGLFLLQIGGILLCFTVGCMVVARAESGRDKEVGRKLLPAKEIIAIQREDGGGKSKYDWGPSVMKDGSLYKMWWVRYGGTGKERHTYQGKLPDGESFSFTYPDCGDRIYYAESRDGVHWNLNGEDFRGSPQGFGPDAKGPLMVLKPAENQYERQHVASPSVIKVDGKYYMYYEAPSEFVLRRDKAGKPGVLGEYHNQIFLAISEDGKIWHKYPSDEDPQPIIPAPEGNKLPSRQRYGLGQPSVFYRNGRFVMHYVDSCTGSGDFIIRIEADNPYFENARKARPYLKPSEQTEKVPPGAVARFAQTDVKYLGDTFFLVRPVYGEGRLGLLSSKDGVFWQDRYAHHPSQIYPQVELYDIRGGDYKEVLFPRFLTTPGGEILIENGFIIVYYANGRGFKEYAWTWDLRRALVTLEAVLESNTLEEAVLWGENGWCLLGWLW